MKPTLSGLSTKCMKLGPMWLKVMPQILNLLSIWPILMKPTSSTLSTKLMKLGPIWLKTKHWGTRHCWWQIKFHRESGGHLHTWELTYQGLHSLLIFNGSWDNHSRVPVTGTIASTSPLFVTPTPNSQHLTSRFTFAGSNKQARGGGSNPALNQSMPRHERTSIQTKFEKRCHPLLTWKQVFQVLILWVCDKLGEHLTEGHHMSSLQYHCTTVKGTKCLSAES